METKSFDELKANPKNPRTMSKHDGEALAKSMSEFGDLSCIVFNVQTGQLVGGHQRIQTLNKLPGDKKVLITERYDGPDPEGTVAVGYVFLNNKRYAYREVDWPIAREMAANIAANRIQGEFDLDLLAEANYMLNEQAPDLLALTGQTKTEIDSLLDSVGVGGEDDSADEAPPVDDAQPAVSKLGQIFQLGKHRLMCGDSTDGANVNALVEGNNPILMVTDPPYGVEYDPEWRDGADLGVGDRSKGKVMNDERVDWTEAYELFGGDVAYVWHAGVHSAEVAKNLETAGFDIVSQIIWSKQHFVLSRGDYHWKHEPCWYAVRKGAKHNWQGDRTQSTVWDIANNNSFGNSTGKEETWGHGTQKPIALMSQSIVNNTGRGDGVYDPFAGSGSTLIACEKLDRINYSMELDPKYCDVIRKRYAQYTNQTDWQAATPAINEVADEQPAAEIPV